MVPVFYALNDTRIPVVGSFLTVAANLVFINLTLAPLQHRAIALSTSLSMILNFLFLGAMLYRKLGGFTAWAPAHPDQGGRGRIGDGADGCLGLPPRCWLAGVGSVRANPGPGRGHHRWHGPLCLLVSRLQIPEFQELMRHLRSKFSR